MARKKLNDKVDKLRQLHEKISESDDETPEEEWKEMVDLAYEIHKEVHPKHHKYMLSNRGVDPESREFYNHIHPVEDLLAFIDNPKANDDPEDQTIGIEFKVKIFSRRWNRDGIYTITRIETGWYIEHIGIKGDCDKTGSPYLYRNFKQDGINYPKHLPGYIEWLWNKAKEDGLTKEQVQEELDQLAQWVSTCEKGSPAGIFSNYR